MKFSIGKVNPTGFRTHICFCGKKSNPLEESEGAFKKITHLSPKNTTPNHKVHTRGLGKSLENLCFETIFWEISERLL